MPNSDSHEYPIRVRKSVTAEGLRSKMRREGVQKRAKLEGFRKKTEVLRKSEEKEANERLTQVTEWVNDRYKKHSQNPDSALSVNGEPNGEKIESYIEHNNEVFGLALELGVEKMVQGKMTQRELRILLVATAMHDAAKGDPPPEEVARAEVKHYVLAYHSEIIAKEVESVIDNHPELVEYILEAEGDKIDQADIVKKVQDTIRAHDGPNPGFMGMMLQGVRGQLIRKDMEEYILIDDDYPNPAKGDVVAETMLAADMASLAGWLGWRKIIIERLTSDFFKKVDLRRIEEYKTRGIKDLTLEEAAVISADETADSIISMFVGLDHPDIDFVRKRIEKARNGIYGVKVQGETKSVSAEEALRKRSEFLKPHH